MRDMVITICSILACYLLQCSTVCAQSFSCDADVSKPLCPGAVVTCTCTVTGTVSQTRWIFNTLCPSARNYIAFPQVNPCSTSSTCGPYITATNLASGPTTCQTSKLQVTMVPIVSGLGAECRDLSTGLPGTLNGNGSFIILSAPGSPSIVNNDIGPNQLTVTWTPPTTGGVPTSYNVSINNSGSPVVIPHNGSSLYIHTFTGLISDTFYTVSVVAINCAGQNLTSSVLLLVPSQPSVGSMIFYTSSKLVWPLPTQLTRAPSGSLPQPSISSNVVIETPQGPTSTCNSSSGNTLPIEVVGTYLAITFIVSFSMGMLVATFILCVCYFPRKPLPEVYHFPPPRRMTTISSEYTGDHKIQDDSKLESIELENNDAYGTVQ